MIYLKICFLVCFSIIASKASAGEENFTTGPDFEPELVDCDGFYDAGTKCKKLKNEFAYFKNGIGWEAKAGLITDGASIPKWAQWIIGDPLSKNFSKAATLHDHYCREKHQVRDYLATHRMFYDALVDSGLDRKKAAVMYAAVLIGGPTWSVSVSGEKCNLVENCIRNSEVILDLPSKNRSPASFSELDMERLTKDISEEIKAEDFGPDRIEQIALHKRLLRGLPLPPPVLVAEQ